jgi:hypothetical protein
MVRSVGLGCENGVNVRIEFGRNECQACGAVQGTRPMLGGGAGGETLGQVVATSPPGDNICTQRREAPSRTAEKIADLFSVANQSLCLDDFPLEFGPQLPGDLSHRRPVSSGRIGVGQLSPRVGERARNRLRGDEQLGIQRNTPGIACMRFPKAQRCCIPHAGRRTASQPAGPPQTISLLDSTRQLIQNFVRWQHFGHPLRAFRGPTSVLHFSCLELKDRNLRKAASSSFCIFANITTSRAFCDLTPDAI